VDRAGRGCFSRCAGVDQRADRFGAHVAKEPARGAADPPAPSVAPDHPFGPGGRWRAQRQESGIASVDHAGSERQASPRELQVRIQDPPQAMKHTTKPDTRPPSSVTTEADKLWDEAGPSRRASDVRTVPFGATRWPATLTRSISEGMI
jgi:hypothetical protein